MVVAVVAVVAVVVAVAVGGGEGGLMVVVGGKGGVVDGVGAEWWCRVVGLWVCSVPPCFAAAGLWVCSVPPCFAAAAACVSRAPTTSTLTRPPLRPALKNTTRNTDADEPHIAAGRAAVTGLRDLLDKLPVKSPFM